MRLLSEPEEVLQCGIVQNAPENQAGIEEGNFYVTPLLLY